MALKNMKETERIRIAITTNEMKHIATKMWSLLPIKSNVTFASEKVIETLTGIAESTERQGSADVTQYIDLHAAVGCVCLCIVKTKTASEEKCLIATVFTMTFACLHVVSEQAVIEFMVVFVIQGGPVRVSHCARSNSA